MPWATAANPRKSTLPGDWGKIRLRILKRDGHVCQIRSSRCVGKATDADHKGDSSDHRDENLQAACRPCHRWKTAKQGAKASGDARTARAAARFRPKAPHPGLLTPAEVAAKRQANGLPPLRP